MKEKLGIIAVLVGILIGVWGAFTYLEKFAHSEDVQKVDKKTDKILQIIEYKFKAIQLETIEDKIDRTKERSADKPTPSDKQRLNELERDKEKVLREMEVIKNQK